MSSSVSGRRLAKYVASPSPRALIPRVRHDDVGAADGLARVCVQVDARPRSNCRPPRRCEHARIRLVAPRRRRRDVVPHRPRTREQRVEDVVAVADPRDAEAGEAAKVLLESHEVGEALERMVHVRERIDDGRAARVRRELEHVAVPEDAGEHDVVEAPEDRRSVAQRLVLPELDILLTCTSMDMRITP